MNHNLRVRLPYGILFFGDYNAEQALDGFYGASLVSTENLAAVAAVRGEDGICDIRFVRTPGGRKACVFLGEVEILCPSGLFCVFNTEWDELWRTPVSPGGVIVKVYGSSATEPRELVIGIEAAASRTPP